MSASLPYNVHPETANLDDFLDLLNDLSEEDTATLSSALANRILADRLPGETFTQTLLRVCHDLGHITTALYEHLTES